MQLFITSFEKHGSTCIITEERIIFQCLKVLRYHIGSELYIQDGMQRIFGKIVYLSKREMQLEILEYIELLIADPMIEICVALPNKRDKLELIVQKLTEIGVARITCWPAQRSQLQEIPAKKLERLETIVREAAEQARLHHIPTLQVYTRNMWTQHYQGRSMIVFDLGEKATTSGSGGNAIGLIGPEGGFSSEDYKDFGDHICIQSLGMSVLRMETAAIVAARGLQHHLFPKHLP